MESKSKLQSDQDKSVKTDERETVDPKSLLAQLNQSKPKKLTIQIEDPLAFAKMVMFTSIKQSTDNPEIYLTFKGEPLASLQKKATQNKNDKFNFPYCFPIKGKELTWHEFGLELSKYKDNEIELIMKVALRMMRTASRAKDIQSDIEITHNFLNDIVSNIKKPKHATYQPIELLVQLIGSAACETGRAPTGFLSVFATFHRIKHYNVEMQGNIDADSLKDVILDKIFPNNYSFETADPNWRHGTGFSSSQNILRYLAELEDLFYYQKDLDKKVSKGSKLTKGEHNDQLKGWSSTLTKILNIASTRMATWVSKDNSRQKEHNNEQPSERFSRKVAQHVEASHTTLLSFHNTYQDISAKLSSPPAKKMEQKAEKEKKEAKNQTQPAKPINNIVSKKADKSNSKPNNKEPMDIDPIQKKQVDYPDAKQLARYAKAVNEAIKEISVVNRSSGQKLEHMVTNTFHDEVQSFMKAFETYNNYNNDGPDSKDMSNARETYDKIKPIIESKSKAAKMDTTSKNTAYAPVLFQPPSMDKRKVDAEHSNLAKKKKTADTEGTSIDSKDNLSKSKGNKH